MEIELLRHLKGPSGRISVETVASGPGLVRIFEFLQKRSRQEIPGWLETRLAEMDPAAAISRSALEGASQLCAEALDLFVSILGAEAGNMALKALAFGGVYLGGGIAPQILPFLKKEIFLKAFSNKGRMSELVASMRVSVITEPRTALLGAARLGFLRLEGS